MPRNRRGWPPRPSSRWYSAVGSTFGSAPPASRERGARWRLARFLGSDSASDSSDCSFAIGSSGRRL